MTRSFRQEVLNVLLAQLLQERGVISAPESVIKIDSESGFRMPDVIVSFRGLRTGIEGEVGYRKKAKQSALEAARRRVVEGIAHIGVAVIYPAELKKVSFADLKSVLAKSELQIAIVTESSATDFVPANVDYLIATLPLTFDYLVQENIVEKAAARLGDGIEKFARAMAPKKGDIGRVGECLGIRELTEDSELSEEERS